MESSGLWFQIGGSGEMEAKRRICKEEPKDHLELYGVVLIKTTGEHSIVHPVYLTMARPWVLEVIALDELTCPCLKLDSRLTVKTN